MYRELLEEARTMEADLIAWRRKLRTMPGLGLELLNTSTLAQEKLEEMGIPYEIKANGFCVAGILGKGSRCFTLRSDMDGLPFQEGSGEEFVSRDDRMHACGHDLHATVLLGVTRLLKWHESELKGQVKLLFQPEGEIFQGARAAVEEGVLDHLKVDSASAMHVAAQTFPEYVAYGSPPMAEAYGFRITLTGQDGYGSRPEKYIDPINTGVHVYLAPQELIARECPAISETALTIGQFCAGSASNVIPETAVLQGTTRSFDKKTMSHLIVRLNEIILSVAGAYRTKAETEVISDIPIVRCNEELDQGIVEGLKELEPEPKAVCIYYVMGSEDFIYTSQKIPASYMRTGAGIEDVSKRYVEHNPKARFHKFVFVKGAVIYIGTAMRWLDLHGNQQNMSGEREDNMAENKRFSYGWLTLLTCILIMGLGYAPLMSCASLFTESVTEGLGFTKSGYVLVNAIAAPMTAFMSPFVGKIMSKPYMHKTLMVYMIGNCLTYYCYPFANTLPQF